MTQKKKKVIIEEVKPKIERNMNWNVIQKKKERKGILQY